MTTHIHIPKVDVQRQLTAMRAAAHAGDLITLTNLDFYGPLSAISRDYLSHQLEALVGDHRPTCAPVEDAIIRAATHCALYAQAEGWLEVAALLRTHLARHWSEIHQTTLLDTTHAPLSPHAVLQCAVEIQVHHDNKDVLLPPLRDLLGVDLVDVGVDQSSLHLPGSRPTGWENWRWLSPVGSDARLAVFGWLLLPLSALPIIADARTNLHKGPYPLRKNIGAGAYGRYLHDRCRDNGLHRCANATASRAAAREVVRLAHKAKGRARSINKRWNLPKEDT